MATDRPRCVLCRRRFDRNPRIGERQTVCSRDECQKTRRRRTQAEWRKRHPGYFIARRAKERANDNKTNPVAPPRTPPPLSGLPWETAQEEFGIVGADFIASMGRLVLGHAKDQIRVQLVEIRAELGASVNIAAKDQISVQTPETIDESVSIVAEVAAVPKIEILPVPP